MELYKKYRPKTLKEIVGQTQTITTIQKLLHNYPHCTLLSGPTGVGKTTIARIIANHLAGNSEFDIQEINCAEVRGIDSVREMIKQTKYLPFGQAKIWILDEVMQLPKTTQQAMLKLLEDTPAYVYFFLCTTDVSSLLPTIRTRCNSFQLSALSHIDLCSLLKRTCNAENAKISKDILSIIAKNCDGSARQAMQILELVILAEDDNERMRIVNEYDYKIDTEEFLGYLLLYKPEWIKVAQTLSATKQEPEGLRRAVLGFCNKILITNANKNIQKRAASIINAFEMDVFSSGLAGISLKCFELCHTKGGLNEK